MRHVDDEPTPHDEVGPVEGMTEFLRGPDAAHSTDIPAEMRIVDPRESYPDQWAIGPDGTRMWGRDGAAGLLVLDRSRGVLLQLRALWSHHGGTWGLPGGALERGEDAITAAVREAQEEAAVPPEALSMLATSVFDLGFWQYTTVIAEATTRFRAQITDAESAGLAWVSPREVERLRLHPGFASSWDALRPLLGPLPTLIVDVANVMGANPDGWWRDREGGIERTLHLVENRAFHGVPASWFGFDAERVWPDTIAVVEGKAGRQVSERKVSKRDDSERHLQREARTASGITCGENVEIRAAEADGDQTIVELVESLRSGDNEARICVVTSDRELTQRVTALGATVIGAGRYREVSSA